MTTDVTSTPPRRSGLEVRETLEQHAPELVAAFEHEFRAAALEAPESFDTTALEDVLLRWWRVAAVRSVRLTEEERRQVARVASGDLTGLLTRAPDGAFTRLE